MSRSKKILLSKRVVRGTASKELSNEKINALFSENALKMMKKRYLMARSDGSFETPAEMFRRVAGALASVEKNYDHDKKFVTKTESDFFEIMARKEYTPAGRSLTNAGSGTALIANCIVLPVMDSMESIFGTLRDAALLQQAGSGLGFDFSHLRPAMSPTKKSRGFSSGPVSFLRVYNEAFGVIKQQGRHGANMAMMQVDHPDVLDFIRAKEVEGDIRNFNISIKITDAFMKRLVESPNEQWYCSWNGEKMKPHRVIRAKNNSVISTEDVDITVKQLFDELVHYAWLNGEPGIVFIDEVNRTNPLPGLGPIDCSNPCVTGDTLVSTEKGLLPIAQLAADYPSGGLAIDTDNRALPVRLEQLARVGAATRGANFITSVREAITGGTRKHVIVAAWQSGIKPVYRLTTTSGYSLTATSNHKILTTVGKVPIGELTKKHRLLIQSAEGSWNSDARLPFSVANRVVGKNNRVYEYQFPTKWSRELGQVLGWLIGDGWLTKRQVGFTFGAGDRSILERLKSIMNVWHDSSIQEIKRENGVYHLDYGASAFISFLESLGVKPVEGREKTVPRALFTAPREAVVGFLQGLFSADGTIGIDRARGNRYIRLTSQSRELVSQVQILLSHLGIHSRVYDRSRPARTGVFGYTSKTGLRRQYGSGGVLYEVNISCQNLPRFLSEVGFIGDKHAEKIAELRRHDYYRHEFTDQIAAIEYVGERPVYDLTEPATASFIANGLVISNCGEQFLHHYDNCNLGSINLAVFVKDGKIDWNRLRFVTKTATRLMDNVIDLFDFPVQSVTELAKKNRRIGLGIMGFADMLYQLGVAYDSKEGQEIGAKVMSVITETAHKASMELAKEKGAFPNLPLSIFAKKRIKMRNAALTTVAPTGSISMMFDCSSGIEPSFALAYVKQDKDGHQYHYFNGHFEAALNFLRLSKDKVKEVHDEVIKSGSIQSLTSLPESFRKTFVVAMDISAEDHMRMQSAFQARVDNSISKTINFPNSATEEEVAKGYILAWQLKCKSATVYRDGSRNVQILNLGTGENLMAPTELGSAKKVDMPPLDLKMDKNRLAPRTRPEAMTGKTYKIKTGYGNLYITINDDEQGVPFEVFATIGKSGGFFQEQSEAICRMISLALRSGIKVESIIDQLKGIRGPMPVLTDKGTVLSLPDAIGQIFEDHVKSKNGKLPDLISAAVKEEIKEEVHVASRNKALADYGLMPGCPDCGAPLQMGEGCLSCRQCGFSRCL